MKMMSPPKMGHFLLPTTLLIVILVMDTGRNANGQDQQPQPNQPEDQTDVNTCGLGGHKLTTDGDTIGVALAEESRELKADAKEEELKKYEESGSGTFKGCKVTMDKEGEFFIVHYDTKAAENGCAVDFIKSKDDNNKDKDLANEIEFTASVKEDPAGCLQCTGEGDLADKSASNENIVPFVFSRNNAKVEELHKGPIYYTKTEEDTCNKKAPKTGCDATSLKKQCISFTALEIRWSKCGTGTNKIIKAYLHPVGEPQTFGNTVTATPEGTIEMQIIGTAVADGTSFKPPISQPACISAADKGIPVPKAWPIDNKKDSYLFVFQLLPQKATLIYDKDGKMTMDKPHEGTPKCKDGLFIKFPTAQYTAVLFPPPVPTTTPTPIPTTTATTMTTTGIPTTGTGTSDKMTTSNNNTNGKDKTTSPSPSERPDKECKKEPLFLVSVISAAVLLVTTIGLIIVIIITCRKLNQAKAAGPIEDGDGAGSKKDEDDGEEEQEEDDEENNKTEEADGNKSLASESVVPASSEEPYSVDHLLAPPGWVRPPRGKTAPPPQFKSGGPYPGGYKMGYKG